MKLNNLMKKSAMLLCMGLMMTACGGDDPDPSPLDSSKTAILTQYVNGVVVPTYKSLADNAIQLSDICADLRKNPSQELVNQACAKWIEARKYWELSEAFLYGAAADYNIDPHIDSWPLQKSNLDNVLANESLMAELDEDGAAADGFSTLGYGLLGFHAVEYVLFRDGAPRSVGDISEKELIYNAAVAEDLANQTVRLEAAWAGLDRVTAAKRKMLEDAELEPTTNYGEQMIQAGYAGNVNYKTQIDAMVQILQGASDISDEVGNTKITDPINSGNVLDVESWYSWNSIADFTDNVRSVRNAYYGSLDGKVNSNSLAAYCARNHAALDSQVREAIEHAITTVAAMPAPFRNHLTLAENQSAIAACNELMAALDDVIEAMQ
ncbi:MAG: peptidase M75 [Muribaculaceae bacterium]|nr:peptidase M75 [Muribaculaceae bacterium]